MTLAEARVIIEGQMSLVINDDNDIVWELEHAMEAKNSPAFVMYTGGGTIQIDGDLTLEQLEALACWMREKETRREND